MISDIDLSTFDDPLPLDIYDGNHIKFSRGWGVGGRKIWKGRVI